jgi:hypothetical protein
MPAFRLPCGPPAHRAAFGLAPAARPVTAVATPESQERQSYRATSFILLVRHSWSMPIAVLGSKQSPISGDDTGVNGEHAWEASFPAE